MTGTIELTNDQLANLVCEVLKQNGYPAVGVSVWNGSEQLGFSRVLVHCEEPTKPIEVFPKPRRYSTREEINELLYPNVNIGNAKLSGAVGNGAA